MEILWQDIRFGARMLARYPGITALVVLVLALGMGANTAIFSVVDAVLLRSLPVVEPDRLVAVYASDDEGSFGTSGYPDYVDYRDQNDVFSGLIADAGAAVSLSVDGNTERVRGAVVTGNYFPVLGVDARFGRTLLPEDDQTPGAHPVAVISHGLWKRLFASDPDAIGKTVKLNGHSFSIVGVISERFRGLTLDSSPDIWVPMMMQTQAMPGRDRLKSRGSRWMNMMGRLKPGVTFEQAQAQMNTIAFQLHQAYPQTNGGYTAARLVPANQAKIWPTDKDDLSFYTWLLMAAVGTVLLIACANVANLLLARASSRRKEIAIRLALGGTRSRILRQLLTESILLALLGGGAGLLIAFWGIELLSTFNLPTTLPLPIKQLNINLDSRVLIFTLAVSLLTGLVFGLAPALQASRPELVPTLKDEAGAVGLTRRGSRLRGALVVAQVALSFVLLITAGLFTRTFLNMQAIDPGFKTDNALMMSVDLRLQGYDEARGRAFYKEISERVNSLPGVQSSTLAMIVPVNPAGMRGSVVIEGYQPRPDESLELNQNIVSPAYFQTMGIPILRGRSFSDQDTEGAPSVVIVNETFASRYWPGQNPVGKRINLGNPESNPWSEVIGIAKDSKYRGLREDPRPYIYIPVLQEYTPNLTLVVRTEGEPTGMVAAIRRQVQALDADLPIYGIKTLEDHLGVLLSQDRMAATLMSIFGLLAMALAGVGIYGVMSYSVTRRTREIGVRVALGAERRDILKLVVGQGMALTFSGLAIGLTASLALTRFVSTLLYGVSATDLTTFTIITLALAIVAFLACYIPARRAAKVDPMVALRYE